MAIKKIVLTARQCFNRQWYEPGEYTRATFKGASSDPAKVDKEWTRFVEGCERNADCPAIKIERDPPPKPERPAANEGGK